MATASTEALPGETSGPGVFFVCRQCRALVDYACLCPEPTFETYAPFDDLEAAKAATRS